jgi:hypothetical protein
LVVDLSNDATRDENAAEQLAFELPPQPFGRRGSEFSARPPISSAPVSRAQA